MAAAPSFRHPAPARWKLTVETVERMVEQGILTKDDPVELLDGALYVRSPQGPYHATASDRLGDRLRLVVGEGWCVREDKPMIAGLRSMPEPDIAVVAGPRSAWRHRHPRGDECRLVVEVSSSSRRTDRKKARIYGAAGVPVYWMLDIEARTLTVHEAPNAKGYGVITNLTETGEVAVPGTAERWKVAELLE